MNRYNTIFPFILFGVLAGSDFSASPAYGRTFSGILNNQPIRLQTEKLQSGEYVRATDLASLFPNRWQYDGLSETLIITRQDGVRIGVSMGSQRIVVGNKVFPAQKPLVRRQEQIYVPFQVVKDYLLPDAGLREGDAGQAPAAPQATPPIDLSSATPFRLSQLPITPEAGAAPAGTPVQFPEFEDLVNTPTPTPVAAPATPTRVTPRAVIVLDPGVDGGAQDLTPAGGVRESAITFAVARKLIALLTESPNFEVLIAQQENSRQPLTTEQRIGFANQSNADLFLSIQCGRMISSNLSKAVVFYMNPVLDERKITGADVASPISQAPHWDDAYRERLPDSLRLARAVNLRLKDCYASANIISMENEPRPGRIAVLRALTMPGVLIELGNLANRETAQHLSRGRVQDDLANYLYLAINDFLYERTGYQYSSPSQSK